ncbi:sugar phosphate isomerase/epimerase family protein [Deferrisoma sp.]
MRYGAMNSPLLPVLEEIELVGRMGFDYVELAMDPPQATPERLGGLAGDIRRLLDRHGLGLVCHLPTFVSTADLTERLRRASVEETVEALRVARDLGAEKVVLHPGVATGLGPRVPEEAARAGWRSLGEIGAEAQRLGISLCVENLFPRSHTLAGARDFEELFSRFPGLGVTLDVGHAHLGSLGGERFEELARACGPRLRHLHASDNFGRHDDHLPIGAGAIDFGRVALILREVGYDDTVTLEVFSRDRDYLRISREKLSTLLG